MGLEDQARFLTVSEEIAYRGEKNDCMGRILISIMYFLPQIEYVMGHRFILKNRSECIM
jgi:hypothetical protein